MPVLLAGLAPPAAAQSAVVVPNDWTLKPSGLSAGDQFRLLFVSNALGDATSTNIADYNTFVQTRAAAGHSAIQSHSSLFRVVGSTAAVDARDNTGTTGTGVPIYWLDGAKVADDYADFYDGSWDSAAATTEAGTASDARNAGKNVFTGSNADGTAGNKPLGNDPNVITGVLSDGHPLKGTGFQSEAGRESEYAFYALSPVFEVESPSSTVRFGAPTYAVDEGDAVAVEVLLSPAQGTAVTAKITATGISATGFGVDFDSGPFEVTFAAGETRKTLSISTTEDTKDDGGDPTFRLTLLTSGLPASVTLGSPKISTVTILDDDAALDAAGPTVVIGTTAPFRTTAPEVTEGTDVTFTLTALPAPASPIDVSVLVSDSGNYARAGDAGVQPATIGTNGRGTLTVRTQDDSVAELPGTITATLRPGTGYRVPSLASSASSSVAVEDNDSSDDNFIYMSTGAPREQQESVREGRRFGVYRANKSTRNETFGPWGFTICFGGTATRDVDYAVYGQQGRLALDGSGCTRISKPGGDRAYFSIDTVDDSHEDSGETIIATVSNPTGTNLYRYGRWSLDFVILNHEVAVDGDPAEPSELSVAVGPASASEGAAGADTYAT